MTDVFICYAREDRERAGQVASALEACGWSVWWDRKIIAGQAFDQAIEHEIETAKCVVVLWSEDSIVSEWVKNEAAAAAERGVLVPVRIDDVRLPLEFRRKQTVDLLGWDGAPSHEGFQALCDAVAARATRAGVAQRQPALPLRRGFLWHRRWTLGATAVAMAVLAVVLVQGGVFDGPAHPLPAADDPQVGGASAPPGAGELESRLKAVNIELSTGTEADAARVRGYFAGPTSAYHLLAVHCLEILGNRRLRKTGYLDMIDKWYTLLRGENPYVAPDGGLDHETLEQAIVRANNEIHGQNAASFEQVVMSIR